MENEPKKTGIKYIGDSVSGIFISSSQGLTTEYQFNPGVSRMVNENDAEVILKKFPDVFKRYSSKEPIVEKTEMTEDAPAPKETNTPNVDFFDTKDGHPKDNIATQIKPSKKKGGKE